MSRPLLSKIAITLVLITILMERVYSQEVTLQPVRVMFYNVENLFDIFDDSLKEDNDFLPSGLMRWNFTRYNKKINSLYKTIVAAGEWNPPSIVAFCEIENKKVLEDLVYGTYLSKYGYRIIHEESPDPRGIDVCMIYRKSCVNLIDYCYWVPKGIPSDKFASRSVLYSKMLIQGDTVHFIINHWPSRRGGVLAREGMRIEIAEMVRNKADSIILKSHGGAKIIIAGDFNSTPDDKEMKVLVAERDPEVNSLVNLSERMAVKGLGTYRYLGIWEMIDQVIISEALMPGNNGLVTGSMNLTIFNPVFLLKRDSKYPGFSPFSTYRGYKYVGGYSDHLPVLLDLEFR